MSTQTGSTERSQVHQWARWYAEQGWSVVPVAPGKKRPGLEWAGYQATRATLEQIDAWYTDLYAQYGVGIITGAISGLVVIDVDEGPGKAGGDELAKLQLKHGDLPETPTVRTGGGGRHLYFKHPGRDADGNPIRIKTGKDVLAPGIDVRGDGGMVVAPPTVHPNGRPYEWIEGHRLGEFPAPDMPDWLIDLCCADVEPEPLAPQGKILSPARQEPARQDLNAASEFNAFGLRQDGREDYMKRLVWARVLEEYRRCPIKPIGKYEQPWLQEMFDDCWAIYERKVKARGQSLEADGRGQSEMWRKIRYAVAKWGTKVSEEAQKPNPKAADDWTTYEKGGDPAMAAADAEITPIAATPWAWKAPNTIPLRDWLYGRLLLRKFVTLTIAPGGVGKTSLSIVETLSMVTGRDLLGHTPPQPLTVWTFNLEDPLEELDRKLVAACLYYDIGAEEIDGRLYVDSGRDQQMVVAKQTRDGVTIVQPVVDSIVDELVRRKIDVLIVDPFVSCHEAAENDNPAIDRIVKEWGRIAGQANCSVHLFHHTRKSGPDAEIDTESARGAKALTDAARVVRTLNRMTKKDGNAAGVENHRSYFRSYNDKENLAPPAHKSEWHELVSVSLGNGPLGIDGDHVGVVVAWKWPDPMEGMSVHDLIKVQRAIDAADEPLRKSVQAKNWIGHCIAEALGLDASRSSDKARIKAMVKTWIESGALVESTTRCNSKDVPIVMVGEWADDLDTPVSAL